MQLFDFIQLMAKKSDLVDFLIRHGVLPSVINCEKCGNELHIDKETLLFRCRKRYFSLDAKKKRINKQCDYNKSSKVESWFGNSSLEIDKICKIVACFLMLRPPRQEFLQEELGVSSHTIVDWFSFCREVIYFNILH